MPKLTLEFPVGTELTGVNAPTQIKVQERTHGIDTWSARLPGKNEDISGLDLMAIRRTGTEILRGRCFKPKKTFGLPGSPMTLPGMGYAGELNRFKSGDGTITNKTIEEAIQEMLDQSPSNHGITLGVVDTFYLNKAPWEYKTSLEFLDYVYTGMGIEFARTAFEVDNGRPDGVNANKLPLANLRCCFYDGARFFVFFNDGANNLKYTSSLDGTSWAAITDTTYNTSGTFFDVTYHHQRSHVHLLNYTGGQTDFYTGTITAGAINFAATSANIFAGNISPFATPIEDSGDDFWVIDSAGDCWESTDDGANWVNRFTATETPHFIAPKTSGEHLYIIEYDAVNDHLELWEWDEVGNAEAYVKLIRDFTGDALDSLRGCIDYEGNIHLIASDSSDAFYIQIELDETVTLNTISGGAAFQPTHITIFVDNARSAYTTHNWGGGATITKYTEGVLVGVFSDVAGASGANVSSPMKSHLNCNCQTGFTLSGGEQGAAALIDFYLAAPYGIGLARNQSSGSFQTNTKSGDGDFERWGILSGILVEPLDITWDIEDTGAVDLATNLSMDADLHAAGVPDTEVDIQLECNVTKSGATQPYVLEIYLSERWTKIETLVYSDEPFGSFLDKVVKITGAEYDLSTSDVLTFVDELGTDHSASVTLEEGVNCESIEIENDWSNYANIVTVIGDGVEAEVRDSAGVTAEGEFWAPAIRDKDLTTYGMCWNRGSEALAVLKTVVRRIDAKFMDDQSGQAITEILRRGDTVQVKSPKTGHSQNARIIELTRISDQSGEKVSAFLVNSGRIRGVVDYWAQLEDIRRQL